MANLMKGATLASRGVRYKLRIAFSLMSIIPLLVCVYLFFIFGPYIAKIPFSNLQIIISMTISLIIAIVGFLVAKEIVDPIIKISSEAKSIAKGEFDRKIDIYREDEIGDLSSALNQLTRRIRDNMDELRDYGERTKQINSEINKRVVVLSGLLQVSNLITQGAKLREIFDVSISKLVQLKDAVWSLLVTKNEDGSYEISAQSGISPEQRDFLLNGSSNKIFDAVVLNKNGWIITKDNSDPDAGQIKQIFGTDNVIFTPIFRHTRVVGFLGVGNSQADTPYNEDDLELLGVFAKQIAIAIENDYLVSRLQTLEIKDTLTGLYNKKFIVNRLDEEIRRAIVYQRPCAFLFISLHKFNEYLGGFGQLSSEAVLKTVSNIIEKNCSEADRVARYSDNDFAVVLPEKNKKQAMTFAKELKEKIEEYFSQDETRKRLSTVTAVSENPVDGSSSKDLIKRAEELLSLARDGVLQQ